MKRETLFNWIKDAEAEFKAAGIAVAALKNQLSRDPSALRQNGLSPASVANCLDNLEATYIVRLFAEFEAGLRTYWRQVRGPSYRPRIYVSVLINNVAGRLNASTTWLNNVHKVRECRNKLVHEQPVGPTLTLAECRSNLCTFLSLLPVSF
jgi:hypothetical protein